MEVAVNQSTSRFIVALLAGAVFGMVGCADVITYSRDAQRHGIKLYNEGNYTDAAGAFRNASRQNPREYRNYYYLGACYEQMGQFQQAIHAYQTARSTQAMSTVGKDDNDFRMRTINGLGRSIARSDQRDIETDALVRTAESKGGGENWFIVAKIYAFRGDADSAIDAYNRAGLLDPQNYLIFKDYGLYLEQIGQTAKAQAPLKRAYSLKADDEQLNLALRRAGVVPGPSLKDETALAKPALPKGPIPELELKLDSKNRQAEGGVPGQSTVEAPRD
jgi:tetratricopeptide (TPR) repeat protein